MQTHLRRLATGQSCDVTKVCNTAQLVGHGHHAPLLGVPLMLRHIETHHHRLLVVLPVLI